MYTNETIYTENDAREYNIALWRHRRGMGLVMFLVALQMVLTIGLIVLEYLYQTNNNYISLLLGAPLFCGGFFALMTYIKIKLERKRLQIIYHGKDPVFIYEIDNNIVEHNVTTGGNTIYEYSHIYKIVESKNLLILMIKGSIVLSIKKNGFTQGSWKDCKEFISQKCKECKEKGSHS